MLEKMLALEGYQTMVAANGQEALEQLAVRRPSLILLDIEMPVMDGYEFRAIQLQDPRLAEVPRHLPLSRRTHRRYRATNRDVVLAQARDCRYAARRDPERLRVTLIGFRIAIIDPPTTGLAPTITAAQFALPFQLQRGPLRHRPDSHTRAGTEVTGRRGRRGSRGSAARLRPPHACDESLGHAAASWQNRQPARAPHSHPD